MAYPVYSSESSSWGYNNGTTVSVPYPASISTDDIIFACLQAKSAGTWTVPTGWTAVLSRTSYRVVMWRRATGGESGNKTFTNSTSQDLFGYMYSYSGCITTGTPYEQAAQYGGGASPYTIPALAGNTTGSERLCVCFTHISGRPPYGSATNYTAARDTFTYGLSDSKIIVWEYQQASAGNPGADSYTSNSYHRNILVALMPPASNYGNDVNGVAAANIAKINGVATADIEKVNGVS